MNLEVRQVSGGFAFRVNSYNVYDVNGYRVHTTKYESKGPIEEPQIMDFVRVAHPMG
jgi:hypothetical protein